jgi:hypothetical protein
VSSKRTVLLDETEHTEEARRFWAELVGTKEAKMTMQELEGYEEVERRILAEIPPKRRLAGLTREEILLAFPDDELRRLPEDYLATFPETIREAVKKRLGR